MLTWLTSMAHGLDRFGEVSLVKFYVFFEWIPFSLSTPSPNPNNPFLCVRQFDSLV